MLQLFLYLGLKEFEYFRPQIKKVLNSECSLRVNWKKKRNLYALLSSIRRIVRTPLSGFR